MNLSNELQEWYEPDGTIVNVVTEKKLKEFIKELKEEVFDIRNFSPSFHKELMNNIDKLAGEKLI